MKIALPFCPYFMAGFPSEQTTMEIIDYVVSQGVSMIEIGIPFSDPAADGPTLTHVNHKMIQKGVRTKQSLELIARIKRTHPTIKICILVYLNTVLSYGIEKFNNFLDTNNIDYFLIPDLPVHEIGLVQSINAKQVLIVSSNLDDDTILTIANSAQGFLYVVSTVGTTGEQNNNNKYDLLGTFIKRLRTLVGETKEFIVGFGVKTKEDIKSLQMMNIDGFIIGSQIAKELDKGGVTGCKEYLESLNLFI